MGELIEEIKAEIPDINKAKEEMFNVWKCIFSRIDKKYYSIKTISSEDVEIIETLVHQMQFSKGREEICKDLGYNHSVETDKEVIKERLFKLIGNLKLKKQQNPNMPIGYYIREELHNIAKKEKEESSETKEY